VFINEKFLGKMSKIIDKFKVLNELKEEFLNEIKLLYVFEDKNFFNCFDCYK